MTDRHPKWVRVEPGTVIPAGQPYRQEHKPGSGSVRWLASERIADSDVKVPNGWEPMFVDSSWKPPLVLPTEPTWGIAVVGYGWRVNQWRKGNGGPVLVGSSGAAKIWVDDVIDFIPLTDEQVARIEQAR